jgi:hypothetical protein
VGRQREEFAIEGPLKALEGSVFIDNKGDMKLPPQKEVNAVIP